MRRALRRSASTRPRARAVRHVRVLDRPAVPREAVARTPRAAHRSAARTNRGWSSELRDRRGQRTERKPVACRERRRRQPILRARAVIAGAEDDHVEHGRRCRYRASASAASRTSIGCPVRRACPARLAGSVAASFATTRSPGRSTSSQCARGICVTRPVRSTTSSRAASGSLDRADPQRSSQRLRVRCVPSVTAGRAGSAATMASTIACAATAGCQQVARIGIGYGERVQRRIHVARVERKEADAAMPKLLLPDPRHVAQRGLARAVGAPVAYALIAASLDTLTTTAPRPRAPTRRARRAALSSSGTARGRSSRAPAQSLRSRCRRAAPAAPGPRLDALLISTSSPPRQPRTCKAIGWISSLSATSPTMPSVPGCSARDVVSTHRRGARDERDIRAARTELADERQSKPRRAAGDRGRAS